MKKLLVVVDYQNDFVSGSLGFKEAVALEDYIYQKIVDFKNNGNDVLFTFDSHQENYLSLQEGKSLPIPHCIEGTNGWQLFGKINTVIQKNDYQIRKVTFGSLELGNYLKENPYEEITFVGVVSNICVISNAIIAKSALPEATIVIDVKGVSSNDLIMQQNALAIMENLQMKVINKD